MTATTEQLLDLDHYLAKTYCKTASLMANSSRSIAVLAAATPEVSRREGTGEEWHVGSRLWPDGLRSAAWTDRPRQFPSPRGSEGFGESKTGNSGLEGRWGSS
jgi:hypothetical protein